MTDIEMLAFRTPNRGLESSLCCCVTGQRPAQKRNVFFTDTGMKDGAARSDVGVSVSKENIDVMNYIDVYVRIYNVMNYNMYNLSLCYKVMSIYTCYTLHICCYHQHRRYQLVSAWPCLVAILQAKTLNRLVPTSLSLFLP